MAQDAGHGCAEEEPNSLLGGQEPPLGPVGRLRWVCGANAGLPVAPIEGLPMRPGADPVGTDVDQPGVARPALSGGPVVSGGPATSGGAAEQVPQPSRLIPRPRTGGDAAEAATATAGTGSGGGQGATSDQVDPNGTEPDEPRRSGCQTDRPGWAGAHRHGAVRPSRRRVRRDRPPHRWC